MQIVLLNLRKVEKNRVRPEKELICDLKKNVKVSIYRNKVEKNIELTRKKNGSAT